MKAPIVPKEFDAQFLQRELDNLYQYVTELQSKVPSDVTAKGTPSGRTYSIYVDDTIITSTTVKAR